MTTIAKTKVRAINPPVILPFHRYIALRGPGRRRDIRRQVYREALHCKFDGAKLLRAERGVGRPV
jgi:hypothetical protein